MAASESREMASQNAWQRGAIGRRWTRPPPPSPDMAVDRKQLRLEPFDVDGPVDENSPARSFSRVLEQFGLSRFESETRAVEGVAGRPTTCKCTETLRSVLDCVDDRHRRIPCRNGTTRSS